MTQRHLGNVQPAIDAEEHATVGGIDAKKVIVFDNAGNQITSFGGTGQATVTVNSLVTLGASPNFIGLTTVTGNVGFSGNVTLNPSPNYVGLVTVANTVSTTFSGNVTLDGGSKTGISGNVTISDSKGFIGLVTLGGGSAWIDPKAFIGLVTVTGGISFSGNVTLDKGSQTAIVGNVTISDSKAFIGLSTVVIGTEIVPSTIVDGMVSAASGSLVQFPSNTVRWATVKSTASNATTIYIGNSSATINNGFPLDIGETIGLSLNNTNLLYLVGVGTSEVRFIGGN